MREYRSDDEAAETEAVILPEITITLDGARFSCVREMDGDTLLEWSELGANADVDADSPEGAAYLSRFLRASFGATEYRRFRAHVREHHTPTGVVLKVMAGIQEEMTAAVEAATGRPTAPPSPSSAGGEDQAERLSRVISWSRGEVEVIQPTPIRPEPGDHRAKGGTARKPRTKAAGGQRKAASAG